MRTIGLLGGMSWYSTIDLYRVINETVHGALGGQHSAEILMDSLDFETIRDMQLREAWDEAGADLCRRALRLQAAGAEAMMIGTNLMHKVAPEMEAALDVPLLHIGDAVAEAALAGGHTRVGLLGTAWTMGETFYADRLAMHGVETIVPESADDRKLVDDIIFGELTLGVVRDASRGEYQRIIRGLAHRGATAVVLGCTEIPLLIHSEDSALPVIDSTHVHAQRAAHFALDTAQAALV